MPLQGEVRSVPEPWTRSQGWKGGILSPKCPHRETTATPPQCQKSPVPVPQAPWSCTVAAAGAARSGLSCRGCSTPREPSQAGQSPQSSAHPTPLQGRAPLPPGSVRIRWPWERAALLREVMLWMVPPHTHSTQDHSSTGCLPRLPCV